MAVPLSSPAYNGLHSHMDLQNSGRMSRKSSTLLEYIRLYSDPTAKDQLIQFLQYHATELQNASFYDAAIVYAAADRDLALEVKDKLSRLSLENNEHPQICLYDEEDLMSSVVKLPKALIDRCALILLLLTENFESDGRVQFVNQQVIENTRFCQDVPHWQFYCVRPLHTKPAGQRLYNVPAGMEDIRSYQVHDMDNVQDTEKLESLFNCYSWFRKNHEKRCCVSKKELSETKPSSNNEVGSPAQNASAKPSRLLKVDSWCLTGVNGQESLDSVSDIETCSDSASSEIVDIEGHVNVLNGQGTLVNGTLPCEADTKRMKGTKQSELRQTTHRDSKEILGGELKEQKSDPQENLLHDAGTTRSMSLTSESLSLGPIAAPQHHDGEFFDAVIVYAAGDRDLALQTRKKLSSLTLENNKQPSICLYDDVQFTKQGTKLPDTLVDRCALILLILTENLEDDKRVKFVETPRIDSTRFKGIDHWQFYCVRPLHTEPDRVRSYAIPHILSSVRSYDVYNLDNLDQQETMIQVFNCYSWFRGNRGVDGYQIEDRRTLDSGQRQTALPVDEAEDMTGLEAHNPKEEVISETILTQSFPEAVLVKDIHKGNSSDLTNVIFYDAVIVYAAADKNLAIEIRNKMLCLHLNNNKHPKICMYDDEEFKKSGDPLPNILVNRCALILLLLTENLEDDNNMQFVNVSRVPNTRFGEVQHWQFYCVRPLHTQPKPLRFYSVPVLMANNRSYDVYDMNSLEQREAIQEMFNCYSWFREIQEGKSEQKLNPESPVEAREQVTEEERILLEYLHLCDDPNSAPKLNDFINEHLSQLQNITFYDATIVYASEDKDLAFEVKSKLEGLKLANNQHPKVCLYNELESLQSLPNILINRCALILLLLTENYSQGEQLHFLNQKLVKGTRFGDEFEDWQFYCVRPLHTQTEQERSYNIPDALSSIRSYMVHDIQTLHQREALVDLFEMYLWFRKGHESRCANAESSKNYPQMFEVTPPVTKKKSLDNPELIGLNSAESVESTNDKSGLTEEALISEKLLSEYMQLCFDPAAGSQLKEFLIANSSKLPKDAFYDAAIVYSAEDKELALEIKANLTNLLLENNERPRVCLYDEVEVGRIMKLPEALINRCALIFLLLTQNFEEDDEVQFLSAPVVNSPRFDQTVQPWQFYCVRPLHTQKDAVRCYEVPDYLESVRSYSVYHQDKPCWEEFQRVISSYQWFRRGHEKRCYGKDSVMLNNSLLEPEGFASENETKYDNQDDNMQSEPTERIDEPSQVNDAVQVKSAKCLESRSYDAAIVYASKDRNLALEIRKQLCSLNLENKNHPKICLYDDEDLMSTEVKLPDALIDQCALILLLLTEGFEDDDSLQFVNTKDVESTRLAGIQNWQFYCMRPLHTQPPSERRYKVPAYLEANRSYEVYDLKSQPTQNIFQDLFNTYSWFRHNQEINTEEHTSSDGLLQDSDKEISDLSEMSSDIIDHLSDWTSPHNEGNQDLRDAPGTKEIQQSHKAPVEVSSALSGKTSVESISNEDLHTEPSVDKTDEDDTMDEEEVCRPTDVHLNTTQSLTSPGESSTDLDFSNQTSSRLTLLSEYIKLCSDPAVTKQQLNDFLQTHATRLSGSSFYDAAIVYAAADQELALEMKNKLSGLTLENNQHPRICLYDGEELQTPDSKLPNVLIDRCALILLLLTENFEQDENVQFLKESAVSNTRFCEDISNWQDYCVRPLHTQPTSERRYAVPFNLAPIHSYDVYDLTSQHARDKMEGLFNCYTWFRVNHERRCRVSEERERKRSAQTVGSDISSPGETTGFEAAILDLSSQQQHYKFAPGSTDEKRLFNNSELINDISGQRSTDEGEITPITIQPERVVVVSAEVLVREPTRSVSHDDVFDETGDGNSEETLKLLQGGPDEDVTPEVENAPREDLDQLLHQEKERQPEKRTDKRGFCCGCLSFLRWGRKSRKSEGVTFMELVDHD